MRNAARASLTAAQERFCAEFLANGGNQGAAARVAYPQCRAASERGRRLLRQPHIMARIAELHELQMAPIEPPQSEPPDTAALEQAAATAFDDRVPDLVRLIALRTVSAELRQWAARHRSGDGGVKVVVRLSLDN